MGCAENKVAVVTGAGSGIGRGIVEVFVKEGSTQIVAVDINPAGLDETETFLKSINPAVQVLKATCNVTKASEVESVIEDAVKTFGRIDCVVNCAGIMGAKSTLDTEEEVYDRVISVNLKSSYLVSMQAIKQFLKQEKRELGYGPQLRGSIVNIASTLALRVMSNSLSYVVSKHGLIGQTKADAIDFAKDGIRVNAVCPGIVKTPLALKEAEAILDCCAAANPSQRLGYAQEIGEAVVFLCSDKAAYITGQALPVDGGVTALSADNPRRE